MSLGQLFIYDPITKAKVNDQIGQAWVPCLWKHDGAYYTGNRENNSEGWVGAGGISGIY